MTDIAIEAPARAPWHLWLVGVLAVLWNGAGAYTIMAAQLGKLAVDPDEAAYYAAQSAWFVAVTDLALVSAIAAGVALLLRSRLAVVLFVVSIVSIALVNGYDLMMGTSRMFANSGALVATLGIWLLAVLQLWYALAMRKRGVLR